MIIYKQCVTAIQLLLLLSLLIFTLHTSSSFTGLIAEIIRQAYLTVWIN